MLGDRHWHPAPRVLVCPDKHRCGAARDDWEHAQKDYLVIYNLLCVTNTFVLRTETPVVNKAIHANAPSTSSRLKKKEKKSRLNFQPAAFTKTLKFQRPNFDTGNINYIIPWTENVLDSSGFTMLPVKVMSKTNAIASSTMSQEFSKCDPKDATYVS